jgi:hypothetical protein
VAAVLLRLREAAAMTSVEVREFVLMAIELALDANSSLPSDDPLRKHPIALTASVSEIGNDVVLVVPEVGVFLVSVEEAVVRRRSDLV